MSKTNKLQFKIVNCITNEETVRDATAEEIAQIELDATNSASEKAEVKAKKAERLAILDRIGLTADELKTILG